ncbi:MAG: hypothetical protein JWP57_1515, partial [Spirosoma sp.]|nr:hypothetical protein [Spirosoma sp.]
NTTNLAISQIRDSLQLASDAAKIMFESATVPVGKSSFSRSKMGDNGTGAVYVYYDANGDAIYVGQTGRYVKSRLYDKTSPHAQKAWYNNWVEMRFLPMQKDADRLVLEFLLIIAYQPPNNLKPSSINVKDLFRL